MNVNKTLDDLRAVLRYGKAGDQFVYGRSWHIRPPSTLSHVARDAYEHGGVILYQRRVPAGLEYVLQVASPRARRFVDSVSKITRAPHNPLARLIDAADGL